MGLLDTIKNDRDFARRSANTEVVTILSTLIGEIENALSRKQGLNSDEVSLNIVKKFVQSNSEVILVSENSREKLLAENALYQKYIPVQFTEKEIANIIYKLVEEGKITLGQIMAHFKANHSGLYDGGVVSKITKEVLNGQYGEVK